MLTQETGKGSELEKSGVERGERAVAVNEGQTVSFARVYTTKTTTTTRVGPQSMMGLTALQRERRCKLSKLSKINTELKSE